MVKWILTGKNKNIVNIIFSDGTVSIDELIRAIIGEMNEFRKNLIIEAFKKMDRDGSGDLTVSIYHLFFSWKIYKEYSTQSKYNFISIRNHPDVKSKKKTETEILNEFLETFEMHANIKVFTLNNICRVELKIT